MYTAIRTGQRIAARPGGRSSRPISLYSPYHASVTLPPGSSGRGGRLPGSRPVRHRRRCRGDAVLMGRNDMAAKAKTKFGSRCKTIDLTPYLNWPRGKPRDPWWGDLAQTVRELPEGRQDSWGVPFDMPEGSGLRVVMCRNDSQPVEIDVGGKADYVCLLHAWCQTPEEVHTDDPQEGLVVGQYELRYDDGSTPRRADPRPVRSRHAGEPGYAVAGHAVCHDHGHRSGEAPRGHALGADAARAPPRRLPAASLSSSTTRCRTPSPARPFAS